ncbi:MAG: CRISPR-associated helicase/endonuclease Cas3, partial [Candidatus Hodarchaeales archaeon]
GMKRRLIGLNRIAGSIIILDEVQNIPSRYWDITYYVIKELVRTYGCTVILASATQPLIVPREERIELAEGFESSFNKINLNRYKTSFMQKSYSLDEFCEIFISAIREDEEFRNKNLMVVMNTKKNARKVFDFVKKRQKGKMTFLHKYKLFFLSSWVIPAHRDEILSQIRNGLKDKHQPIILVCTQVIEAGVDVSFDIVYRDFAPLDSIIQVAGRCNRHLESRKPGKVLIYPIKDDLGKMYSQVVYRDPISLAVTQEVIQNSRSTDSLTKELNETDLRIAGRRYFELMRERKNTRFCLQALQKLDFQTINTQFRLIEEDRDAKLLYVIWDERSKDILQQIKRQIKTKKKHRILFNHEFYQYCVNISEREITRINTQFGQQIHFVTTSTRKKEKERILFYYLKENSIIYDEGGLRT